MINSTLYHTLPTIRKMRRILRRMSNHHNHLAGPGLTARIVLRNSQGQDCLKILRWRNRFITTNPHLLQ